MSHVPGVLDNSNFCFSGSQQQTNNLLSDPNVASALQKLVEKRLPVIVVPIIKRFGESLLSTLEPMMENSVRKVVKEQLDIGLEKLNARAKWIPGDETHTTEAQHLALKFLDKVCLPVYTGREIKAEGGSSIKIALVDADGNLVNSGSAASSEVEIIVLPDGIDDSDSGIGEPVSCSKLSEKKLSRPLLSKNYLKLKEGIAVLDDMKFKNKQEWTKSCRIKLVARTVEKFSGTTVQEAKTESFPVSDCRSTLYKKHDQPSLSDEVWRLKQVSRGRELHKRLQDEKINTVEEFLISYNMDPQSLQQKLAISAEKFKVIVDHAKTCEIRGNQYKYYSPSCERNVAVIFDVVGDVQGLLHDDRQFVPVDDLAEDEKVAAHKMVISAFQHREDIQSYDIEASTSDFPAQVSNDVNTSFSRVLASPSGSNMGPNEAIDGSPFANLSPLMPLNDFDNCPSETVIPDLFDIFSYRDDNLQSANQRIEANNVQDTGAAVCNGSSAHVQSSRTAKGRWKMVVFSVGFCIRSARKRDEAPEYTHAQKKQRRC